MHIVTTPHFALRRRPSCRMWPVRRAPVMPKGWPIAIDAELVARIEALAGERLVEFPQIDIPDLQAMTLQQLRHREDWADAHFVRLTARRRPGDEAAERMESALFGILGFHQHHGRCAIRKLAGVAGGDVFARSPDRFELGETFQGRL